MSTLSHPWLAQRTSAFDSSGIRRVFDLAATLKDPINFSIGQPDFDVPDPVKQACIAAINEGRNSYSQTQGIAPLRDTLQARIDEQFGHGNRKVFITSGTSGGLVLSMFAMVDPGDEVIFFDPYFVMYPPLIKLVGGVPVAIDTYPDFKIDVQKVADSITSRTKMILLNSPSNPTGILATEQEQKDLANLAAEKGIALVSDEIYSRFCYADRFISPAEFNDQTIVIDGFSKSHAMTGWRVGFVHGPTEVIETMTKLQQYSFVCAPQPAQWGALAAVDVDVDEYRLSYRGKRDRIIDALKDDYQIEVPGGAFYIFPKAPWGTGTQFVEAAIAAGLLIIPGGIFSRHDTHFRISYAASDATIERGIEVLKRLARQPG
ncbi:MAG: aminotransferase class I/II-fold pyridoxal phosphate-dependent enzyme [Pirellulaceae bacterium]